LRRDPKAWLLVAICVIVPLALLFVAMDADDDGDGTTINTVAGLTPENAVLAGDHAPTFRLVTLDGEPLDTANYRGRPYVLTFWGSWCVPCRKEMPLLQGAYEDGTAVIGVTYQDPPSESRRFAEQYNITFPLAADDGLKVARSFGVGNGVPQTFFVDRDGVVRDRVAGIEKQRELDEPLDALLRG
jgi:peroxiredoxin